MKQQMLTAERSAEVFHRKAKSSGRAYPAWHCNIVMAKQAMIAFKM